MASLSTEEILELLYQAEPHRRIINAIHRMTLRYGQSMVDGRYRRSDWQAMAVVRLSQALHRYGQQHP